MMTDEDRDLLNTTLGVAMAALEALKGVTMIIGRAAPALIPALFGSLDEAKHRIEIESHQNPSSTAGLLLAAPRIQSIEDGLRDLEKLLAAQSGLAPLPP